MTQDITTASPSTIGRERTCTQCATTYRALRNTSTYCSTSCRQKGARGTLRKAQNSTQWSPITKALHKVGYVGISGPVSSRSKGATTFSLTVPHEHAFSELSDHFNRSGWGSVSREEFSEALRADGIEPFYALSPEALAAKQWRDKMAQREKRQF